MDTDEWFEIPSYSTYRITKNGRIKRIEVIIPHNNRPGHTRRLKERFTKGSFSDESGWGVSLTDDTGKRSGHLVVARLMLMTFDRLPEEGEIARHLDDDKHNQDISNLAWGTVKDNAADAIRNDCLCRGSTHGMSKLTEDQVREIKSLYIFRSRQFGITALGIRYGVSSGVIWNVVRGFTWRHVK